MSLRNRSNVPAFSRKSTMTTYPPMLFFLCMPVGLRDLVEMGAHGALGAVGIAGGDGLVDRLVSPIGDELLAGHAQGDGALLGQPGHDRLVDRGEDRVARNHRQHVMERHVSALEGMEVVQRMPVCIERALEGID